MINLSAPAKQLHIETTDMLLTLTPQYLIELDVHKSLDFRGKCCIQTRISHWVSARSLASKCISVIKTWYSHETMLTEHKANTQSKIEIGFMRNIELNCEAGIRSIIELPAQITHS